MILTSLTGRADLKENSMNEIPVNIDANFVTDLNPCESVYIEKLNRMHKYRYVRGAALTVGGVAVAGAAIVTWYGTFFLLAPSIGVIAFASSQLSAIAVGVSGHKLIEKVNKKPGILKAYNALSLTAFESKPNPHLFNALDELRCMSGTCLDYETVRLLLQEYKQDGRACLNGKAKTLKEIAKDLKLD